MKTKTSFLLPRKIAPFLNFLPSLLMSFRFDTGDRDFGDSRSIAESRNDYTSFSRLEKSNLLPREILRNPFVLQSSFNYGKCLLSDF